MLMSAGASLPSILLYPVRRRVPPKQARLDLRGGTVVTAPANEPLLFLFREIWVDGAYDEALASSDGLATIVDIGAHVGLFSIRAASRWPQARVVAVEASPRSARYLRENVARNRLATIAVVEAACGGSRRRAVLHRKGADMMSSLYAAGDGDEVDVITLEDVFDLNGVDRCDLLKLDCEGAEYEIILGAPVATLRRIRRIVMECHRGGEATPADLERHLAMSGFDVRRTPSEDGIHEYLFAERRVPEFMPLEVAVDRPAAVVPH
jgi:FkbM family methyltransferase